MSVLGDVLGNGIQQKTKEAYFYGNYIKQDLTKYGFKINLNIDIQGYNEKKGKIYKITSI